MKKLTCKLHCFSSTDHLSYLYTGFGILSKLGLIKTTLNKDKNYKVYGKQGLMVTLNNKTKIFYDMLDGAEIYESFLNQCDFYFKRSFDPALHQKKIKPLGLSYPVTSNTDYSHKRFVWGLKHTRNIRNFLQVLRNQLLLRNKYKIDKYEGYPHYRKNPKVLFLARLWDYRQIDNNIKKDEWIYINSMRADCIRNLRKEFKEAFTGGVYPNNIALEKYRDIVVEKSMCEKSNYLQLVRDSSICIATMGLYKSTGWKMAEYIAGAKAIVSEKLYYEPYGAFENGKHYLEFNSAEDCVEKVLTLYRCPRKCFEMARANYLYYHECLRPDILVWNTLNEVLTEM